MGLFKLFKKKDNRNNYEFSEEDRKTSLELRKLNAERKKILSEIEIQKAKLELEKQKYELDELRAELSEDEEEETESSTPETLLTTALLNIFLKGQMQNQNPSVSVNKTPSENSSVLTQEDVFNIVKTIPDKYLKRARKMSDEELLSFGKLNYPNLSEEQMKQIINYIKTNN